MLSFIAQSLYILSFNAHLIESLLNKDQIIINKWNINVIHLMSKIQNNNRKKWLNLSIRRNWLKPTLKVVYIFKTFIYLYNIFGNSIYFNTLLIAINNHKRCRHLLLYINIYNKTQKCGYDVTNQQFWKLKTIAGFFLFFINLQNMLFFACRFLLKLVNWNFNLKMSMI